MNKILKKITPECFFMIIGVINIFIMLILLLTSNGAKLSWMTYGEGDFCDFWRHIKRILNDSIYGNMTDPDAIFPPLLYCFLNIFATIVKERQGISELYVSTTGYGILCLIMYLILFVFLFIETLQYFYKSDSRINKAILAFILIFSYPFWGGGI